MELAIQYYCQSRWFSLARVFSFLFLGNKNFQELVDDGLRLLRQCLGFQVVQKFMSGALA